MSEFVKLWILFVLCSVFNSYIVAHEDEYIKRLADCVAIKSVSAWRENRQEIFKVIQETGKVLSHKLDHSHN